MSERLFLGQERPLDQEADFVKNINTFIESEVTDRQVPQVKKGSYLGTGESQHHGSYLFKGDTAKENSNQEINSSHLHEGGSNRQLSGVASASRAAPKLAYGKNVQQPGKESHDMNDKVHELHTENLKLKERENLLEREIKKMQTKLQRIDELIIKSRHGGAAADTDNGKLARELEEQFGTFKDENSIMKDRVRKLKTVLQGLSQQLQGPTQKSAVRAYNPPKPVRKASAAKRPQTSKQPPLLHGSLNLGAGGYSVHQSVTMSGGMYAPPGTTADQKRLIEDMKVQLRKNMAEITRLQREKDKYHQTSTGQVTVNDVLRKIREREGEIRDISHQFDAIEAEFIKKEKIFIDSKAYMEEVIKQIQEAKINNQTLHHKNIMAHMKFAQTKSLQDQLRGLDGERVTLENSIRRITSEPFLNRDKGDGVQSGQKRIADLEQMLNDKEKNWRTQKETEHKKEHELKALMPQIDRLRAECDVLKKENDKIKADFTKNAEEFKEFDIYNSLFKLDPNKYAQTIGDMNQRHESYPIWSEIDFLERPAEGLIDKSRIGNVRNTKELKDQISQLRLEIMKLRQENKDFAAELEKAQNLLHLQSDIERDNNKYYENEKERLVIMQKQIQMKAEELARRADEKSRQLADINKKLGLTGGLTTSQVSALPQGKTPVAPVAEADTQSEFSAVTNESVVRPEENVLDLAVQDAEYYYDAFKTVLDEKELLLHQKTLVTFVTIDFYNHDTETSQLAEGFRPLYNTQFSFKNRVDDFYVQYLQKNTVKLDVYISKNNAAIHLGHAEVYLRDLIERETPMQDVTGRTPVIAKPVRVFGAKNTHTNTEQHLGILKLKMRLRKPVGEAVRYFRERNEIETIKAMDMARTAGTTVSMAQRKKIITIQIVGAKDLKVRYGDVTNVSPFFYYQFYDFDERYSATAIGKSPIFEDTQNYEVLFDAKMVNYLQRENLEVILFDDNAPITGNDRGSQAPGEQADDMIGSALIPLRELIKGASIHDRYPIRKIWGGRNASDSVGTIEVKISIVDADLTGTMANNRVSINNASQALLHYNEQWEKDLIYRIAKRLATIPGEVELHFGIFARGQKSVTKEDFKYTCLKTLRLDKDITEKEMDMFIHGCKKFLDRQYITHEDFVQLFSEPITNARHDLMDENAMKLQTINQFGQFQAQQSIGRRSFIGDNTFDGNVFREQALSATRGNTMNFSEQELLEILTKMRVQSGGEHKVVQRLKAIASESGTITQEHFEAILTREGNISQYEAGKVYNFFGGKNGDINLMQFVNYLASAAHIQSLNSPAVQKFVGIVQNPTLGESVTRAIISQDIDKDGLIKLDGFRAAVLSPEYGLKVDEASEAFHLLSREGVFCYKDFLLEKNPNLKNIILGSVRATSSALSHSQLNIRSESQLGGIESGRNTIHQTSQQHAPSKTDPLDMSLNESRLSLGGLGIGHINLLAPSATQQPLNIIEDSKLRVIKNKLKDYMTAQDITLTTLFKLIDTNSDSQLTISEFKQKMKALQVPLDDTELVALFQHIDKLQRGTIDYQGFVQEFPEINISYMLKKIKTILRGSRIDEETAFNEFCLDRTSDALQRKMTQSDFKRFVKKYVEKAQDFEIEMLLKHFAVDPVAELTKTLTLRDFKEAFGREIRDLSSNVSCNIEDIIKPLATKIRLFKIPVARLFEKYDKNQNRRLSAEELAYALKQDQKIDLQEDEINAIREYFRNRHNSLEINELAFLDLLNVKFTRTFDEIEAKKSLSLLKHRIYQGMGRTAIQICQPFDAEGVKRLTLRNFKHALHQLKLLTQYQVDNLTKYLDTNDDGFIMVDHFDVEMRNAQSMQVGAAAGSTMGRSLKSQESMTMGGQTTQKWRRSTTGPLGRK